MRESLYGIHSTLRQQQEQLHALREEVRLSRMQLDEDSPSMRVDKKIYKVQYSMVGLREREKKRHFFVINKVICLAMVWVVCVVYS